MNLNLDKIPSYEDILKARQTLSDLSMEHWLHEDLLTPSWWFLVASTIIPYFIWWKLVDKDRYFEILSLGLLSACLATILDVVGVDLLKWGYPDKLFSMIPPLFPADLVVIPVSLMLVYQYYSKWKTYLIAITLWAAVLSYLVEPLFIRFHLFALHGWTHTNSFFGFIAFGVFIKAITGLMIRGIEKSK